MAEGIFNALAGSLHSAQSAGTRTVRLADEPKHDFVSQCMSEKGYHFVAHESRQLTEKMVEDSDRIIVMTKSGIPDFLRDSPKAEHWDVRDFEEAKLDEHRVMRDQIEQKMKELITRL